MKLRVLLVDDEPLAISLLENLLADVPDVEVVGTAGDGEEATALIEERRPHVVLTDIRMPRQGGLTLARALREAGEVDVIFITAFDQFALHAFDMDVVDYLLKPVQRERLIMALDKVRRRYSRKSLPISEATQQLNGFWIPQSRGPVWVPLDSIDWIEAARDYVLLHTATSSYILRSTMDALEKQLDTALFVRVSRSAFVRAQAVTTLHKQGSAGHVAVLASGAVVKVGGKYARTAEELLVR